MKPRHHLYLDDDLTTELEILAAKPGASKSAIVADALRQYMRNRGGNEQEQALRQRLDKISQQNRTLIRDMEIVTQTLSQFVHIYLLMTANLPSPDATGRQIADARYDKFANMVGQALANNATMAKVSLPSDGEA
ncbi:MAG: CopG family transcriptional regulator [Asticcacaulis sp.]